MKILIGLMFVALILMIGLCCAVYKQFDRNAFW